jgi:hypothetical protein
MILIAVGTLAVQTAAPGAETAVTPGVMTAVATPRPCKPTAKKQWIAVHLAPPKDRDVTAVTVMVRYPDGILSIPERQSSEKVVARIGRLPAKAITGITDLDTALKVVLAKPTKFAAGEIFTVEFDRCADAPRATAEDFRCVVEAAANSSGPVEDVSCSVRVP